jgi:DNA repair protein RecN (Recombination protein N)
LLGTLCSLYAATKVSSNRACKIWFRRRIVLSELRIENLGVIEKLEIVLTNGLTALTGETGAGKTMLVEAISLLVGGRADASIVRPGAQEARVEGRFVDQDGETVLARVIPLDGRSRAYVNGRLATVGNLAEQGATLVDLHGQHAHQSLLSQSAQRMALDVFAGVDLTDLRAARAKLTEIDANLAAIGGDERARAREIDLLSFQVEEISGANLTDANEDQELEREEDLLADAVAHREALWQSVAAIADDGGAGDGLAQAISALGHRDALNDLTLRLRALQQELSDVASDLRAKAESTEEDPQRLEEIRKRRQLLVDLRRKYGESLADVIKYGQEVGERLSDLQGFEQRASELDAERKSALAELAKTEKAVGAKRRAAAPKLASAVEAHLKSLAMNNASLAINVGDDPGDEVVVLLSANPGSPLLPLTKVASGGELARTMLALRLVLTQAPGTLVFDEVDAGIGGTAAVAVANALADLGQRHQVLVVTHLAQVAAAAQTQVNVTKTVRAKQTFAMATALDGDDRVAEIARMLSGGVAQGSAIEHARDLLSASSPKKRRT